MKLPFTLLSNTIASGNIYFITKNVFVESGGHYFICIKKKTDGYIALSCCTSKYDTIMKFIKINGFPESTIVTIASGTEGTEFNRHTYIDCNNLEEISVNDFVNSMNEKNIRKAGQISDEIYGKIVNGLLDSPEIEDEMKDELR